MIVLLQCILCVVLTSTIFVYTFKMIAPVGSTSSGSRVIKLAFAVDSALSACVVGCGDATGMRGCG